MADFAAGTVCLTEGFAAIAGAFAATGFFAGVADFGAAAVTEAFATVFFLAVNLGAAGFAADLPLAFPAPVFAAAFTTCDTAFAVLGAGF